ncbi:MAG TPA: ISAs1 family transposase, partial [Pirellulales bacterium]|nr:ISAs1 family transposase [Pirellulales bacterium]
TEVGRMAQRVLSLVECFSEVEDPRVERGKQHWLIDILCLAVLAVVAGAEGWEDIEEFGHQKQDWLKRHLRLPNGIPSHDTISRVFRQLKPAAFQQAFGRWIESLEQPLGLRHVAIDGKTLRRSHDRQTMKSALHAVCAWSVENHLVLGQQATDQKSNEITAIPAVLQLLQLNGALITIDAMGCQKPIAAQIVAGGGDYVLAVKDNQPRLHAALQEHFLQLHETDFKHGTCRRRVTRQKAHGREEQRSYYHAPVPEALRELTGAWAGLASVGQVISMVERDGKEVSDVRYYISSLPPHVSRFAAAVRGHWGIENSLHWVLDMTFSEDQSRIRKDHGPDNFALLRRFAISLLKQDSSPGSIRRKRKRAAWNHHTLATILNITT